MRDHKFATNPMLYPFQIYGVIKLVSRVRWNVLSFIFFSYFYHQQVSKFCTSNSPEIFYSSTSISYIISMRCSQKYLFACTLHRLPFEIHAYKQKWIIRFHTLDNALLILVYFSARLLEPHYGVWNERQEPVSMTKARTYREAYII